MEHRQEAQRAGNPGRSFGRHISFFRSYSSKPAASLDSTQPLFQVDWCWHFETNEKKKIPKISENKIQKKAKRADTDAKGVEVGMKKKKLQIEILLNLRAKESLQLIFYQPFGSFWLLFFLFVLLFTFVFYSLSFAALSPAVFYSVEPIEYYCCYVWMRSKREILAPQLSLCSKWLAAVPLSCDHLTEMVNSQYFGHYFFLSLVIVGLCVLCMRFLTRLLSTASVTCNLFFYKTQKVLLYLVHNAMHRNSDKETTTATKKKRCRWLPVRMPLPLHSHILLMNPWPFWDHCKCLTSHLTIDFSDWAIFAPSIARFVAALRHCDEKGSRTNQQDHCEHRAALFALFMAINHRVYY